MSNRSPTDATPINVSSQYNGVVVPTGVYLVCATLPFKCNANNTLTYTEISLYQGSTLIAVDGRHCAGNPVTGRQLTYSISAVAIVTTATASISSNLRLTFNVVNAYTKNTVGTNFTVTRIA
jgi:hypothetical protein